MNNEIGSSCPMPSCPDNYGTMPSCAGLAVPYVPFQQTGAKKYSQSDALSNGTLFPGLNLPFHLKAAGSTLPSTPLVELQALEFVVLELGTYLDTHPDDTEAFELLKQYSAMEQSAKPPMRQNTALSPKPAPQKAVLIAGFRNRGPGTISRMR